ncbi:MAG: endolytic transglycosylase MltG [Spirochaetia bacterium]|nr:endolytic transglycosylase MltG [Spirochaetia bacterium]
MKKSFGITAFITLALLFAAGILFIYFDSPVSADSDESIVVEIGKGETLSSISENLAEKNLIRSPLLLQIISRIKGTDMKMKSGQYSIRSSMSTLEIHNLIVSGSGLLYKVTIPEGLTSSRISVIMEKNRITAADSFIAAVASKEIISDFNISSDSLEGYLFPDSYFFPQNYPAEKVVSFMVENFFRQLKSIYPQYSTLTAEEIRDRVTIASIVEREYRVEKEAPLIASVFFNRIDTKIPLGSCATVEYVITEIQKKPHPEFLTYDDIAIQSPYNTYIHRGLPPSPISNPGRIAIDAAFNPAESDFYYFLLKDKNSGEHFFSRKLSEHNEARVLYLKK